MPALLLTGGARRSRLLILAVFLTIALVFFAKPRLSGFPSELYHPPPTWTEAGTLPPVTTDQDAVVAGAPPGCMPYERLLYSFPKPLSEGRRKFPYMRPPLECRTFVLPAMESLIEEMRAEIRDPDLFRLFENSFPNTLDTMIKWRGFAVDPLTNATTDQELTYVITGDIDAMWLRDSASQVLSYASLLEPSSDPDSLASLWRGLVNAQARYVVISPYCHSFQPPPESGIPPTINGAYHQNNPNPPYNPDKTFDCKWELDSLASFLQISATYYERTGDAAFFGKYGWVEAVAAAVDAAGAMRLGTYTADGKVEQSAWTFTGWTNRGSETLTNDGLGNPVKSNGMVRSGFRPSDDACIFQLLVPANMMFARYLEAASEIMARLDGEQPRNLTGVMRDMARGIRAGIDKDAVVSHSEFGDVFAYEVDGYGGANLMDDANIPSLLAMPLWNFTTPLPSSSRASSVSAANASSAARTRDYAAVYRNTRRFVLSDANSYFMRGPIISAVGGPHVGPGKAWPMAAIIAGLTAYAPESGLTDEEAVEAVAEQVLMVLDSTSGFGVVHESVNSWNEKDWTRAWFGWANGLFGELILRIREEEARGRKGSSEGLLARSWQ